MASKKMTLLAASREFFGLHNGQTSMEFMKEYKGLTQADRDEIKAGLEQNGYEIMPSVGAMVPTGAIGERMAA